MAVLEVGKPYIAGLPSIEPRIEYNFHSGQHELLLCFSRLTEEEVTSVGEGDAEFGLLTYGLVIFFLYQFSPAVAWNDAPYSWHLVPADERQPPETPVTAETRPLLHVILVDADRNIVRVLREVSLWLDFSRALHAAIAAQAACPWNQESYDEHSRLARQRWPATEQMLNSAIVRMRVA